MSNTIATIYTTKAMKQIECGKILETLDVHGNTVYMAVNKVDNETTRFWSLGGAKLHLELSGMLRG